VIQTLVPAIWSGVFLLALAGIGHTRWRGIWAMFLLVLSVATALYLGAVRIEDALTLPRDTGLGRELALLLLWGVYGSLVRTVGFPTIGPPWLLAPVLGALIGELGAAAVMGVLAQDRQSAARLALAAAGGAMIGRVGDPALLLLTERTGGTLPLTILPVALGAVLIAAPWKAQLRTDGLQSGDRRLGWVTVAVFVGAFVAPLWALGAGVILAAALTFRNLPHFEWREPLWVLGSTGLVLVAVSSGIVELAATGLEDGSVNLDWFGVLPLFAAVATLGAFIGAPALALFLAALVDRALDLRMDGFATVCAVACAVGPLGSLVVARALRKGLVRWILQVALGMAWVWVWTRLR
jgi:hypothetical protein